MFKNLFKWGKKRQKEDDKNSIDDFTITELDEKSDSDDEHFIEDIDEIEVNLEENLHEDLIDVDEEDLKYNLGIEESEVQEVAEISRRTREFSSRKWKEELVLKIKSGLSKTRKALKRYSILKSYKKVKKNFEDLEEVLITADVDNTSLAIIEELRQKVKEKRLMKYQKLENF